MFRDEPEDFGHEQLHVQHFTFSHLVMSGSFRCRPLSRALCAYERYVQWTRIKARFLVVTFPEGQVLTVEGKELLFSRNLSTCIQLLQQLCGARRKGIRRKPVEKIAQHCDCILLAIFF